MSSRTAHGFKRGEVIRFLRDAVRSSDVLTSGYLVLELAQHSANRVPLLDIVVGEYVQHRLSSDAPSLSRIVRGLRDFAASSSSLAIFDAFSCVLSLPCKQQAVVLAAARGNGHPFQELFRSVATGDARGALSQMALLFDHAPPAPAPPLLPDALVDRGVPSDSDYTNAWGKALPPDPVVRELWHVAFSLAESRKPEVAQFVADLYFIFACVFSKRKGRVAVQPILAYAFASIVQNRVRRGGGLPPPPAAEALAAMLEELGLRDGERV